MRANWLNRWEKRQRVPLLPVCKLRLSLLTAPEKGISEDITEEITPPGWSMMFDAPQSE